MYHCVCYTCKEEKHKSELDEAQAYFNEHAEMRCEVEILSMKVASELPSVTPTSSANTGRDGQPADK